MDMCLLLLYLSLLLIYFNLAQKIVQKALWVINTNGQKTRKDHTKSLTKLPSTYIYIHIHTNVHTYIYIYKYIYVYTYQCYT